MYIVLFSCILVSFHAYWPVLTHIKSVSIAKGVFFSCKLVSFHVYWSLFKYILVSFHVYWPVLTHIKSVGIAKGVLFSFTDRYLSLFMRTALFPCCFVLFWHFDIPQVRVSYQDFSFIGFLCGSFPRYTALFPSILVSFHIFWSLFMCFALLSCFGVSFDMLTYLRYGYLDSRSLL